MVGEEKILRTQLNNPRSMLFLKDPANSGLGSAKVVFGSV
jgi:hypothetical protein